MRFLFSTVLHISVNYSYKTVEKDNYKKGLPRQCLSVTLPSSLYDSLIYFIAAFT